MNFKINESVDKLRGGYYTPLPVASFLTRWANAKNPKSILEPSCGDGVFIASLPKHSNHKTSFTGIEVISSEAEKAKKRAQNATNITVNILCDDYLEWALKNINNPNKYDAVVGNPPYIRYQYLEKKSQLLAEQIFSSFNLPFTKHTNAWVPFVIASVALLSPGGRIAMVIPAEILHVLHAASLRRFLLDECDRILLIDPNELLFEGVLQGTILLMAEKKKSKDNSSGKVAITHMPNNTFLQKDPEKYFQSATYIEGDVLNGKWMKVLLTPQELLIFETVKESPLIKRFSEIATVDVGIVTGANDFFLVNDDVVKTFSLQDYIRPMFGRSQHCAGIIYDKKAHSQNREKGLPTNFVMLEDDNSKKYPMPVQQYLKQGEKDKLHTRYKCRIRTPWYKVPSVYATEIGMLKRSHNFPRLILNTAKAFTTDTAYRIQPKNEKKTEELVFCFINSLTALTAELEGRHYGGGVLELVPSEIEKLLIPIPKKIKPDLITLDEDIRNGKDAGKILRKQDRKILKAIGLSSKEIKTLHDAWKHVRSRRQRLIQEPKITSVEDND